MYRLTTRNTLIFAIIVSLGALICALTSKYFGGHRMLSFTALLIGEIGWSFIPVILIYSTATPFQAGLLASIFFLTTLSICFAAWGISNLVSFHAVPFMWKEGEFHINTHSLLIANLFSLAALAFNFKLTYDEELTKEIQQKRKDIKIKGKPIFTSFQKPLLKRPQFEGIKRTIPEASKPRDLFEDEVLKPFDFEPETEFGSEELPEESSGKLYSQEIKETPKPSEFFDDDDFFKDRPTTGKVNQHDFSSKPTESFNTAATTLEKSKSTQVSTKAPSDIKTDLAAIFEQYSSLNAVKKLTSVKATKSHQKLQQEPEVKQTTKKPSKIYTKPKEISVRIQGQDVHEASFREITETEKLEEIKEELKKELQDKIQEKTNQEAKQEAKIEELKKEFQDKIQEKVNLETQKIEEVTQKTAETKEEIIQNITSIKEELKKELQDKIQERVNLEAQKMEETSQKTAQTKEEIIQSIKNIKQELVESLKEELKKELQDKIQEKTNQEAKQEAKIEELKKELQDKIQERVNLEAQKMEETSQKTAQTKEEIIQSIKNIKQELVESLKEELKKEISLGEEEEIAEEEIEALEEKLVMLNKDPKVLGGLFISKDGNILVENWKDEKGIQKELGNNIASLFNSTNDQINKTKQGHLCHLLLESENGVLILQDMENGILTLPTSGTGEAFIGQMLTAIAEEEEK